ERLMIQGYRDLREVPDNAIGDGGPRRGWGATLPGRPTFDPRPAIFFTDLGYPLSALDFETIQFAVPIWTGTHPYERLPFQWSCSVEQQDGTVMHREFLDISGSAPMRPWAE